MKKGVPRVEKEHVSAKDFKNVLLENIIELHENESRKAITDQNTCNIYCAEGQFILTIGNTAILLKAEEKVLVPAGFNVNVKSFILSKMIIIPEE